MTLIAALLALLPIHALGTSSVDGSAQGGQESQGPGGQGGKEGFNFGNDCSNGTGSFFVDAQRSGASVDIGVIPAGRFAVRVDLESASDLDISLFDLEATEQYPEGQAVVQWCSAPGQGNCGLLGQSPGPRNATYKGMRITYSGYNGQGGQKGHEFIDIEGMSTTRLMMRAFSFKAGKADVRYSWSEGCGGQFTAFVPSNGTVVIGEVPMGVADLKVNLKAHTDVDIQLYDLDTPSSFTPGAAIVAYCTKPCNFGPVTSPSAIEGVYRGVTYGYSGWDGVVGAGKGSEAIAVHGTTNRRLLITAYGFEAGQAEVTYSYGAANGVAPQPEPDTPEVVPSGPFVWPLYSQQCSDDAGPPFGDDPEIFGDKLYHSKSQAIAVLHEQECAGPVKEACKLRAGGGAVTSEVARAAYLEGPLQCGGRGWFCRILPAAQGWNTDYGDWNFNHCNRTDYGDSDGHCHGSSDDDVYYWWVRDHWHRNYAGNLHCCCDWGATVGVVSRCDYRAPLLPGENEKCRDANEDHSGPGSGMSKGFEEGCGDSLGDKQAQAAAEPDASQCWDVLNFAPGPDDWDD